MQIGIEVAGDHPNGQHGFRIECERVEIGAVRSGTASVPSTCVVPAGSAAAVADELAASTVSMNVAAPLSSSSRAGSRLQSAAIAWTECPWPSLMRNQRHDSTHFSGS